MVSITVTEMQTEQIYNTVEQNANMNFFCLLLYIVGKLLVKVDINHKFIHWATRGRLNNHCNNKGLVVWSHDEWRPVFFTLPQSRLGLPCFIASESRKLYMAALAIE